MNEHTALHGHRLVIWDGTGSNSNRFLTLPNVPTAVHGNTFARNVIRTLN